MRRPDVNVRQPVSTIGNLAPEARPMFIATLIADPSRANLDRITVQSLRDAWGGDEAIWLNPGIAAEFAFSSVPANRWTIWQDLQTRGLDLVVQRSAGRRKALLIADMDSTMIGQECIDELAEMAGIGPRVAEITRRAMNGDLDFESALLSRVSLLAGLPESVIDRVITERITCTPGGHRLIATMKAAGGYAVLVSGGFTAFAAAVAGELGFDEYHANRLLVEDGKLTGDVARPILGREAKIAALTRIAARLGLAPTDALAVGDGANDLGMLGLAGTGVALHAKPAVAARCDIRINHGDLTALLYLQGYSVNDFA